jgi:hypothetical protein
VEGHGFSRAARISTKPALAAEGNYELPQDLVSFLVLAPTRHQSVYALLTRPEFPELRNQGFTV